MEFSKFTGFDVRLIIDENSLEGSQKQLTLVFPLMLIINEPILTINTSHIVECSF